LTLFQHQLTGASWLSERPKAYLGDEPGLGKTRTLAAAIDASSDVVRPLIVCPAIVRTHWRRELATLGFGPEDAVVKSYDEITRGDIPLMVKLIRDEKIDALVLDEAHYLKHSTSHRTNMILGRNGYARRLDRVWLASGTPQPKHPGELWTMLSSVFPEVVLRYGIKTAEQWKQKFCIVRGRMIRGVYTEKVVGVQNVELLQEILHHVMLRRTLGDVGLDVPKIWWQQMRVDGELLGDEFATFD
jgi:SWI/SNF-related matrix-associated actin-dependent regulator 1 of chromatin subfamily A